MRFFLILLSFLVASSCQATSSTITLVPPTGPVKFDRTFFGMHVHNKGNVRNWPNIPIGSIRLWDANVAWKSLEPEKGTWDFKKLDEYVEWAQSNEVEVLLVLGVPPRWASARQNEAGAWGPGTASEPSDIGAWRNYVRTVVHRYRGRIVGYQVWNEANLPEFYSGSMENLVELVKVASEEIRVEDPRAIIVAPSGQGLDGRESWVSRLGKEGVGSLVDVISYHFYHAPSPPESMIAPALNMRALGKAAGIAKKPLWNTESGYWMPNQLVKWSPYEQKHVVSVDMAALYIPRDMLLTRALGVERFYWYAWDSSKMGFKDPVLAINRPVATVLSQFIGILMRSTLHRCDRSSAGLWSCQLTRANGLPMVALWVDPSADMQQQDVPTPLLGKWIPLDGKSQWQDTKDYLTVGSTVIIVSGQR